MKKTHFLLLALSSTIITACGGSSDGSSSSNPQIAQISYDYSDFDFSFGGSSQNFTSFSKISYELIDNVLYQKSPHQIIKGATIEEDFVTFYMADSKIIKSFRPEQTSNGKAFRVVENYSEEAVTFTPYNTAKDTRFKFTGKYEIKDLANVLIKDSKSEELMLLQSKLPSTLTFPQGAKCRSTILAKIATPNANEAVVFLFSEDDKTDFTSLEEWKANKFKAFNIDTSTTVTGIAGGKYSVEGFKSIDGESFTGILYNGSVYEALIENATETSSEFEWCEEYNQIASDFIVETVKKYNK